MLRLVHVVLKVLYVPDVGGVDTNVDPDHVSANIVQVFSNISTPRQDIWILDYYQENTGTAILSDTCSIAR